MAATLTPCPRCEDLEVQCSQLRHSLEQFRADEEGKFAALQRVLDREIVRRLDAEAKYLRLRQEAGALPHENGALIEQ